MAPYSVVATLVMALAAAATTAPATAGPAPRPADACGVLPREDMRVRLTINSTLLVDADAEIRRIVDHVWSAEGLKLQWVLPGGSGAEWDQVDAWIVVGHDPAHRRNPTAIGSVLFGEDGVPRRLIRLSVDAAQDWVVRAEARRLPGHALFERLRRAVPVPLTTRALGYAAAHEIGHFVLASKSHAGSGLMQATYRHPDALEAGGLQLDEGSRKLFQSRLAAAARCR